MYGYSKPIIKESFNPDRTKLIIFLDKTKIPKINNKSYNNKLDLLSSDEEKTLEYIKIKNEIARKELEDYLSCSKTKCNNILNELLQKELITKKDFGKNVKYRIN